ncbi:hypothetical protein BST96_05160 [Oceanicoccus sagamiensis]|uniref:Uncharacterized protein n=2 Tax=Oceanicoccus sagamiensis TaxID=716816 RepID=A0A1X9N634_9GAMM|nr:hypothetical protein BST96_05160 [Oceanicoccus sagamiensis]
MMASHHGDRQLIERSSQLFGDSLAQQLARDASNPLVQGDKLSLQSIVNKLVASPIVLRGAIYDVENRPIAEAGEQQADGQSLSASITFQDSIAGYAVITLDAKPLLQQAANTRWQLAFLALLLSAFCYLLALIPARRLTAVLLDLAAITRLPKSRRDSNTGIDYPGQDELQQLAAIILAMPAPPEPGKVTISSSLSPAILAIEIVNLKALQQDPNTQQLSQGLAKLKQQLEMICKLYEGELQVNRSNGFSIHFKPTDDENNYPFRALCSGYLIVQWMQDQDLFTLHAGLALDGKSGKHSSEIDKDLALQATTEQALDIAIEGKLVINSTIYNHASVGNRVQSSISNHTEKVSKNSSRIVETLLEPYGALLERQLETLKAQVNP